MLYADKQALETDLKVSLLAIRDRELNFYVQNLRSIATQAGVMSGFAYAARRARRSSAEHLIATKALRLHSYGLDAHCR